jgi:hypothetical protein
MTSYASRTGKKSSAPGENVKLFAADVPVTDLPFTRRRFLAASGSALAASSAAIPVVASTLQVASSELLATDFRRVLNSSFDAASLSRPGAGKLALKLTDVSAARFPHPSLAKKTAGEFAFSLKFASTPGLGLVQDTYAISHPELGEFVALMVPTKSGTALRAEFHRL